MDSFLGIESLIASSKLNAVRAQEGMGSRNDGDEDGENSERFVEGDWSPVRSESERT